MSTSKHIDKICLAGAILSLVLMLVFLNGEALGIQAASRVMGYEQRLFDTSKVHTLDIVMDDWDSFLSTCENEEYAACSVVIDEEAYKNVGIRAKGNTSLSSVSSMGSDRYSFKIEFDQYDSTKTYHGLDKLSLNNLIQDNTMMKDYLTYQMMGQFGAVAPLCSYVYITVNGEDWGLYLAVEGVEESFLQRNYGSDYGELYKPDSMDMGGGFYPPIGFSGEMPEGFDPSAMPDEAAGRFPGFGGGMPGGGPGGMGSSGAKLQYIDDDPDSYSTIFDSAKTDITDADKSRLIQSLKALSEGAGIEDVVAVEDVIRYFVIHNFVVNGDSYTGSMIHNYYLYEEDGRLAMLPWDYNLAFGGFQSSDATDTVNDPIDTPLSVTGNGDRPMIDWIFSSEEYTQLYHQLFAEFLENTDFAALIDEAAELIAPYVEKDPIKFCTYEEFETGAAVLREFCLLRAESVRGQLSGTIPATSEAQQTDASALIDASHITISDMGTMGMGGRGGPESMGNRGGMPGDTANRGMGGRGDRGQMPTTNASEIAAQTIETAGQGTGIGGAAAEQGEPAMPNAPDLSQQPAADSDNTAAGNGEIQFSGGMQRPLNVDGEMSENTGRGVPAGGVSNGEDVSQTPSQNEIWVLMGVSALILLIGLIVAFKFRR